MRCSINRRNLLTFNYQFVRSFKSNYFESGNGFKLEYSPTNASSWSYSSGMCGGNFTSPNGIITSPSFPEKVNNDTCVYIISSPNGTHVDVKIMLLEIDMYEMPGHTEPCQTRDCIEIRDGPSEQSQPLIEYPDFPGEDIPYSIQSTQNQVWMRYSECSNSN